MVCNNRKKWLQTFLGKCSFLLVCTLIEIRLFRMLKNKKRGGGLLHSGAGEAGEAAQTLPRPGGAACWGAAHLPFPRPPASFAPSRGSESLPCLS